VAAWRKGTHPNEKLRTLAKILYRCDLPTLFEDLSKPRKANLRSSEQEARAAARVMGTATIRVCTYQDMIRHNAIEHVRALCVDGEFCSLTVPVGEVGPIFKSAGDSLAQVRGCVGEPPQFLGLELLADLDDAEVAPANYQDDLDVRGRVFFRIIHPRPRRMRTARLPLAAGGRISGDLCKGRGDDMFCHGGNRQQLLV
jgi:hypothetical protein